MSPQQDANADDICGFMDQLVAMFPPDNDFILLCQGMAWSMRWAIEEPDQTGVRQVIEHLENIGEHE